MKSRAILHQGSVKIEFFHVKRLVHNTRIRIEKKFWNKRKQYILAHDSIDVDALNELIISKRKQVDGLILADYNEFGSISIDRIKVALLKASENKLEVSKSMLIADLFQTFIDSHKSTWARVRLRRFMNIKDKIADENVHINEVDRLYLKRLLNKLAKGELGNGINANTLKYRFKKFKSFYRWCVEKGFAKHNEHLTIVYKEIKDFEPDFITLTEEMIQQLFSYKSEFITYNKVRDTALILAFTGMRYSDFQTLSSSDLVNGYIDKISIKTKIRFKVPIHPDIEQLLLRTTKPLPQQKFNNYFKKVGRDLNWDEEIRMRVDFDVWETKPFYSWLSSHVGRHTAATRWLLQSIPAHVIKIWGGWKSDSMINHYGAKISLSTNNFMSRIPGKTEIKRITGNTINPSYD
jgi:integrase